MIARMYTANLQAGMGMIDETRELLRVWESDMTRTDLNRVALENGLFPSMGARRVRNFVAECFAPRYLVDEGEPARLLKQLQSKLPSTEIKQLFFIYTCRANEILADFVCEVYWPYYSAGKTEIQKQDAVDFVVRSNQDGKTSKLWAESTVTRVASYLIGCCSDFGLLESGARKSTRQFNSFRIQRNVALYLSYELHFSGHGDNAVVGHQDWRLFGLEKFDVVEQLKTLSLEGHFVIQAAGGVINVGWKYNDMQGVIDAISK